MIKANFNAYGSYITDSVYQWDLNRKLAIYGLNLAIAPEIHFSTVNMGRAIVRQSTIDGGAVTVNIPNSLLQTNYPINVYVGVYEGETFKVIETLEIPVISKEKPTDYTIEDSDEEIYSFNELDNRINGIIAECNLIAKDYVTPQTFGAKGDGVTDDTEAIKSALTVDKPLYFPSGTYLITEPLIIPSYKYIKGSNKSNIKKVNATTTNVLNNDVNAIFILSGQRIKIENIRFVGDNATNQVNAIMFGDSAYQCMFTNIRVWKCYRAFSLVEGGSCWMCEFNNIHCTDCEHTFYFYDSNEKTSLTFKNCYVQNCGTGYLFKNTVYSNLISCAGDYVNHKDPSNPYGDGGHGNKASFYGVYHFNNCKGISVNGCGTEMSYGNGVIYATASTITIDGIYAYGFKSEYDPTGMINSYGSKFGLGALLMTGTEYNHITISNGYISGFETSAKNVDVGLVAFNYLESPTSPPITKSCIHIQNVIGKGLTRFCGLSYNEYRCIDHDKDGYIHYVNDEIRIQNRILTRNYELASNDGSNKIQLKFKSTTSSNLMHIIKLTCYDSTPNETFPQVFEATLGVTHLTEVVYARLLNKNNDEITVEKDGLNVNVVLPASFTNVTVAFDIISKSPRYFDYASTVLI